MKNAEYFSLFYNFNHRLMRQKFLSLFRFLLFNWFIPIGITCHLHPTGQLVDMFKILCQLRFNECLFIFSILLTGLTDIPFLHGFIALIIYLLGNLSLVSFFFFFYILYFFFFFLGVGVVFIIYYQKTFLKPKCEK